jgi:hypothetical protein
VNKDDYNYGEPLLEDLNLNLFNKDEKLRTEGNEEILLKPRLNT